MIAHAHGAIWKDQQLLTSNNMDIKYASQILQLLRSSVQTLEGLNNVLPWSSERGYSGKEKPAYQTIKQATNKTL